MPRAATTSPRSAANASSRAVNVCARDKPRATRLVVTAATTHNGKSGLLQAHNTRNGFYCAFHFACDRGNTGVTNGVANIHALFDLVVVGPTDFAPDAFDRIHIFWEIQITDFHIARVCIDFPPLLILYRQYWPSHHKRRVSGRHVQHSLLVSILCQPFKLNTGHVH